MKPVLRSSTAEGGREPGSAEAGTARVTEAPPESSNIFGTPFPWRCLCWREPRRRCGRTGMIAPGRGRRSKTYPPDTHRIPSGCPPDSLAIYWPYPGWFRACPWLPRGSARRAPPPYPGCSAAPPSLSRSQALVETPGIPGKIPCACAKICPETSPSILELCRAVTV